jgi:hypothetical protein
VPRIGSHRNNQPWQLRLLTVVQGYGDQNVKMAKKVENGNVWLNLKGMKMNVNVLHGVPMDDT